MPKPGALRPGWTAWPHSEPFQLGRLGFSFKVGDLKADVAPVPGTRKQLTRWRGEIWRDDARTVLAVVDGDDHSEAMREVELACRELETTPTRRTR